MSNVSIFEKKWIDLVFEGKNKAYGAYQLRQQSPRTTLFAFFAGLLFIASVSGLGLFLSSFGNHPPVLPPSIPHDSIVVVNFPPVDHPKKDPVHHPNTGSDAPVVEHPILVVAPTPEAAPTVPSTPTEPTNGNGETPGNGPGPVNPIPGNGGNDPGNDPPSNKPEMAALLDKQPEFPGGIKKFYEYVGRNFDKPNIDEMESISVNVSFVIEKDGSMTDIKVLRNPGYGLDKEAIRVLKSLRTKWTPGVKNGQYVRTQYTLPIRIQLN